MMLSCHDEDVVHASNILINFFSCVNDQDCVDEEDDGKVNTN